MSHSDRPEKPEMKTAAPISDGNVLLYVLSGGLLLPFAMFLLFFLGAFGHILIKDYLMYFLLLSTMVSFSFSTAVYYYRLYVSDERKDARFLLLCLNTFIFALIFLANGALASVEGIAPKYAMLFTISQQYGLVVSALFFLGMAFPLGRMEELLYRNRLRIWATVTAGLILLSGALFLSEPLVRFLYENIATATVVTGLLLLGAALLLSYGYLMTRNPVLPYYALGLLVMAHAGYIPFFSAQWSLLWWYSILVVAAGYTSIFIAAIKFRRKDFEPSFHSDIPFYHRIGTRLMVMVFMIGLLPLAVLGLIVLSSIWGAFSSYTLTDFFTLASASPELDTLRLLVFRFASMIFLLSVLAGFFAFYYSSKLMHPLKELYNAANRISKGEKGVAVNIATADELEVFAGSFNSMSRELEQLHSGLEKRIDEQTQALNEKLGDLEAGKKAMYNLLEDARILESNLQDERDKSSAIIASISEGLFVIDSSYSIILMNPAAEKLLGIAKGEYLGKNLYDVVTLCKGEEALPEQDRPVTRTIQSGEIVYLGIDDNMYFKTVAGRRFPVVIATSPIKIKDLAGAVNVFRDISEEKSLEDAKSSFISTASHQLRTPLTSIRWYAEMLIDDDVGTLNKDQKEFAQEVYDGAVRLHNTINTLLSLSRIESGKLHEELSHINVKSFIKSVTDELSPLIEEKKLTVKVDVSDDLHVEADTFMLHEVVSNLVSNSIRYTNEGGTMTFGCSANSSETTCSAADDGIGIPDDQKDKIFGKFFRAENAVNKVPDGSGLGLNLVKSFVEKWGGRVWFESAVNKGTTFYFTIPHHAEP